MKCFTSSLLAVPGVSDLITLTTTSTTVTVGWTQMDITYILVAQYISPCVGIEPLRMTIQGRSGQNTYVLAGLHEHSSYLVHVWPEQSVTNATTLATTTTAGEWHS